MKRYESSDKSYVTIMLKMCPVCGKKTETNSLMLHKKLKNVFEKYTVGEFELCEDCFKEAEEHDGMWLIEAEKTKDGVSLMGQAYCVKSEPARQIFGNVPAKRCAFIEPEVSDMLRLPDED